jgi:Phospholipase_D-nuclease N-terminal
MFAVLGAVPTSPTGACAVAAQAPATILVSVNTTQILLLVGPIVILELALIIFALRDLLRPERRVRGDSKVMWGIIVVVFGIIGPVLYFLVGREVE